MATLYDLMLDNKIRPSDLNLESKFNGSRFEKAQDEWLAEIVVRFCVHGNADSWAFSLWDYAAFYGKPPLSAESQLAGFVERGLIVRHVNMCMVQDKFLRLLIDFLK